MSFLPRMERIAQLHRDRAVAIAVALAAAWLLCLITDIAGSLTWFGLLATILATVVVLGNSDSLAGLILLGAMILQWWLADPGVGSWWVVPAAWLILTAHVAVALTASGPDQAPIPRPVLASWVPRTILVGLATTVVAILGLLIEPTNKSLTSYGVAVALLALVAAVLVLIRITADSEEPDAPGSSR